MARPRCAEDEKGETGVDHQYTNISHIDAILYDFQRNSSKRLQIPTQNKERWASTYGSEERDEYLITWTITVSADPEPEPYHYTWSSQKAPVLKIYIYIYIEFSRCALGS